MRNCKSNLISLWLTKIVALVLLLVGSNSLATELAVTSEDITEIEAIVNAKVPFGKDKGLTLNTAVRRPLYVLGAGKKQSELLTDKLNQDTVTIANYYHNGEFYVAEIPLSKVKSIVLLEAPFAWYASHTMLKFETESDARVKLVAKIENQPKSDPTEPIKIKINPIEKPIELKDMVISIDGTEPLGLGKWNMGDAIKGKYTITYRMVSVPERFRWFVTQGTPIKQTPWKVSAEDARNTLRRSIEESHKLGFSSPYNLFKANCTNLALRLVKKANPYQNQSEGFLSSIKNGIRRMIDFVIRPTEPFTQFTQFNLQALGWLEKRKEELQKSPEFRAEIEEAVVEFRNDILKRTDLTGVQKEELIHELGLGATMPIINDPKKFRKAIKLYKAALLKAEDLKEKLAGHGQCSSFYN